MKITALLPLAAAVALGLSACAKHDDATAASDVTLNAGDSLDANAGGSADLNSEAVAPDDTSGNLSTGAGDPLGNDTAVDNTATAGNTL
ncbi:hypothetical protein [Sphingomonas bacterium]|uniref:hypothetical protein n=1 Tax=Sphingomonas bacterium TaxID=1895847 RepID=UPI001575CBB8|nr:hypothetical protein [Sphingomonas bacterium]